jgi:hypothetical protein
MSRAIIARGYLSYIFYMILENKHLVYTISLKVLLRSLEGFSVLRDFIDLLHKRLSYRVLIYV